MAVLSDAVKTAIVQGLACFMTPTDIARSIREDFDITISRQQVHRYDPEGSFGNRLAPRWRLLHGNTRRRFLDEVADIPIALRAWRLRCLNELYMTAWENSNLTECRRLLERAAIEVGYAR